MRYDIIFLSAFAGLSTPAIAQDHSAHMQRGDTRMTIVESGQSAFGALQEIVLALQADPETDWSRVNIDGLRAHLVDMDNVTLRSIVRTEALPNGAAFHVTSDDPTVQASIRTMVPAHAATMNGTGGLEQVAETLPEGAVLRVTGDESLTDRVLGLGFFGILSLGAHHQTHHLAMAGGSEPHDHSKD